MSHQNLKRQLVAIEGGGDWYDASVEYLDISTEYDADEAFEQWNKLGRKGSFSEYLRMNCDGKDDQSIVVIRDD